MFGGLATRLSYTRELTLQQDGSFTEAITLGVWEGYSRAFLIRTQSVHDFIHQELPTISLVGRSLLIGAGSIQARVHT